MNPIPVKRIAAPGALAALLFFAPLSPVRAQAIFPTPEAAAEALADSVARHDDQELQNILGKNYEKLIPKRDVAEEDKTNFLAAWAQGHKIVPDGSARARVEVGTDGWLLPIPLVKVANGWKFDPVAAADEMRTRRIGRNELAAIQASLAFVDAQREYASIDRNDDGVLEYAQHVLSSPGKHDGLYWPTDPGENESPLGPLFATREIGVGYHGYHFRILKAQGPHAQGGARDYMIGKRLRGGFALIAWPVRYGESGVMTFIVNYRGVVYEKNLGPDTDKIARAVTRFDPDSSWTAVKQDN